MHHDDFFANEDSLKIMYDSISENNKYDFQTRSQSSMIKHFDFNIDNQKSEKFNQSVCGIDNSKNILKEDKEIRK